MFYFMNILYHDRLSSSLSVGNFSFVLLKIMLTKLLEI
jgi:hypothetical protein